MCVTDQRAGQNKPSRMLLSPLQLSPGTSHCPSPNRSHVCAGTASQASGHRPLGEVWGHREHPVHVSQPAVLQEGKQLLPQPACSSQRPPSWPGFSPSRRHPLMCCVFGLQSFSWLYIHYVCDAAKYVCVTQTVC